MAVNNNWQLQNICTLFCLLIAAADLQTYFHIQFSFPAIFALRYTLSHVYVIAFVVL